MGTRKLIGKGLSFRHARQHRLAESFLGIDSLAPYTFKNTGSVKTYLQHVKGSQSVTLLVSARFRMHKMCNTVDEGYPSLMTLVDRLVPSCPVAPRLTRKARAIQPRCERGATRSGCSLRGPTWAMGDDFTSKQVSKLYITRYLLVTIRLIPEKSNTISAHCFINKINYFLGIKCMGLYEAKQSRCRQKV
jgi:hypothetical protein